MAMTFPINQGQDLYRVFMIYPQPIANRGYVIFMGSLYIIIQKVSKMAGKVWTNMNYKQIRNLCDH